MFELRHASGRNELRAVIDGLPCKNPALHMPVQAEKILMNATLAELKMALPGTSVWPRNPSVYEINTWVWVTEGTQDKSMFVTELGRLRSSGYTWSSALELSPVPVSANE